jgi:hypothetical protein
MIIEWPSILKNHQHILPKLDKNVSSSGVTLSGQENVVISDAGFWRYGFTTMIWNPRFALDANRLAAWISFIDDCEVRANRVRVPIYCVGYDIITTSGFEALRASSDASGVPHSDLTLHSDGTGYGQSLCSASVVQGATVGATSLRLTFPQGMVPSPSNPFSNGDSFYRIKRATKVSGTTYDVTFLPRLRTAVKAGQEFSFDQIYCLMRLTDEAMARVQQDPTMVSSINLEFTEALR